VLAPIDTVYVIFTLVASLNVTSPVVPVTSIVQKLLVIEVPP